MGLGIMTTVTAPNLVFYKVKKHKTNANNKKKANLEEDHLSGGTEDCSCPRLDGYKVHKP